MQYDKTFNPALLSVVECEAVHQERTGKVVKRLFRLEYRYKFSQSEKIFFRINLEMIEPETPKSQLRMVMRVACQPLKVDKTVSISHVNNEMFKRHGGLVFSKAVTESVLTKILNYGG